ncbi:MAG TPA: hypothetical protein DCM27_04425 [Rhodospirillaceae bacterium]|nr:hypothetical protein [Rhodospirillaceae bacterium]
MKQPTKYCAIYTRKSTEEGLDMEFNSLDAQREACAAYIMSQKAEGWGEVKAHYDDGGYSGGNMERPGLRQLLLDIEAGKVHIVVVYKIDRLTRSLMDFSKLVETFDKYGVTFVSVTQSFNTTTSMGRLTLNVLLSFAQFEREVIGERVRDKIAASKKKGMWMGGNVPIGYRVENRQLIPDHNHVSTVQRIFERYLELGCVSSLQKELERDGVKSRSWVSKKGIKHPSCNFSRGLLYKILRNPIYIGQIAHKSEVYDGQHDAIIPRVLWDNVQEILAGQAGKKRGNTNQDQSANLLKGKLFDTNGNFYSPTYTAKKGKQYHYYINQSLLQNKAKARGIINRFPVHEFESRIENIIREKLTSQSAFEQMIGLPTDDYMEALSVVCADHQKIDRQTLFGVITQVMVAPENLEIEISVKALRDQIEEKLGVWLPQVSPDITSKITAPFEANRTRNGALLIQPEGSSKDLLKLPPEHLKRLLQGIIWRQEHFAGKTIRAISRETSHSEALISKLINASLDVGFYSL